VSNPIRDQILARNDLVREKIDIHDWGENIYVQCFSGIQRAKFELEIKSGASNSDIRERLAVRSLADEKGELLFTEEDIPLLREKNASNLDIVALKALKINKITEEDLTDLVKNSMSSQS